MNVIVIGGGASGLMAALTAARNGHAVTLLERQSRVGRKLLSTGNGRCNLTNLHVAPVHYHGLSPDFVRPALDAFDTEAALAFFHGLGLLTVAEDSGRVYPYSDQAGSVLDVLRFAADTAGVITRTGFEVEQLRRTKHRFAVSSARGNAGSGPGHRLRGGMAGGKLGGTPQRVSPFAVHGPQYDKALSRAGTGQDRHHLCQGPQGRPGHRRADPLPGPGHRGREPGRGAVHGVWRQWPRRI